MPEPFTHLSDIEHLGTAVQAPRTIRFSQANAAAFQRLRATSFPGGHAKERGGTLVADRNGIISLENIGGHGSTSDSFFPDLVTRDPARYKTVGTFHTHPYDAKSGWVRGVSFSGADIAHLLNNLLTISVVQSGPRLFAFIRTAVSPTAINPVQLNALQNGAIWGVQAQGRTFQQASRIAAQQVASLYGLAYYQGSNGVLTRVQPV